MVCVLERRMAAATLPCKLRTLCCLAVLQKGYIKRHKPEKTSWEAIRYATPLFKSGGAHIVHFVLADLQ